MRLLQYFILLGRFNTVLGSGYSGGTEPKLIPYVKFYVGFDGKREFTHGILRFRINVMKALILREPSGVDG
jgi:hypothetical protein